MDPIATNYDSSANYDDGSCTYTSTSTSSTTTNSSNSGTGTSTTSTTTTSGATTPSRTNPWLGLVGHQYCLYPDTDDIRLAEPPAKGGFGTNRFEIEGNVNPNQEFAYSKWNHIDSSGTLLKTKVPGRDNNNSWNYYLHVVDSASGCDYKYFDYPLYLWRLVEGAKGPYGYYTVEDYGDSIAIHDTVSAYGSGVRTGYRYGDLYRKCGTDKKVIYYKIK